eukprot:g45567.t1
MSRSANSSTGASSDIPTAPQTSRKNGIFNIASLDCSQENLLRRSLNRSSCREFKARKFITRTAGRNQPQQGSKRAFMRVPPSARNPKLPPPLSHIQETSQGEHVTLNYPCLSDGCVGNSLSKATLTKFEHQKIMQGLDLEAYGLVLFAFTMAGLGGSEPLVKLFDLRIRNLVLFHSGFKQEIHCGGKCFCAGAVLSSGTRFVKLSQSESSTLPFMLKTSTVEASATMSSLSFSSQHHFFWVTKNSFRVGATSLSLQCFSVSTSPTKACMGSEPSAMFFFKKSCNPFRAAKGMLSRSAKLRGCCSSRVSHLQG